MYSKGTDMESMLNSKDQGSPINTSNAAANRNQKMNTSQDGKINQTTSMSFTAPMDLSREKIDLQEAIQEAMPLKQTGEMSARGSAAKAKPPTRSFAADGFVFTHKFGGKRDWSYELVDEDLPEDIKQLDPQKAQDAMEQLDRQNAGTLNNVRTFFTLAKGFCATGVVYLPQQFYFGGWGFSSIALFLSYLLTLICSFKLIDARIKSGKTSFMDIGEHAYGKVGQKLAEISIICSQTGFVTAYVYFIASQLQEVMVILFDTVVSTWYFGIGIFLIYTPLCWVRKMEKFSATHIFADLAIVVTAMVVLTYASVSISKDGLGEGVEFINLDAFLYVIGFAIYTYEGIGIVLPVMDLCEKKESYKSILFGVMTMMMAFFIFFGLVCYFAYGSELATYPIILSALYTDSNQSTINEVVIISIKLIFCVNLVFSYPLVIYPANILIESYLFGSMRKSLKRQWSKNIYRACMVAFTVVLALLLDANLGKFLGLLGAFSCTPVAFTLPTLFHYKICAETQMEKIVDLVIIILSLGILIFTSGFALIHWGDE